MFPAQGRATAGIIFHHFVKLVHILHSTLVSTKMMVIFRLMVHSRSSRCLTQKSGLADQWVCAEDLELMLSMGNFFPDSALLVSDLQLTRNYKTQWVIRISLKICQAPFYGFADQKHKDFWIFITRTCLHFISVMTNKVFICLRSWDDFILGPVVLRECYLNKFHSLYLQLTWF